ncbi:PfkB family carbohydrate kinase [Olivibacter sp. XZL3]|uniref:PfkB family carbohydrate kinase n=1 Tax=Olivibacter sp. XZL3 TaxID=1735116 RepID=UPI001064A5C8|nr:PfkB family carbohydrate kinase [Olivibacter sp. XZL3]
MFDICCIGHITLDTVVTTNSTRNMPGGTSFYFSNAIKNMDVDFKLVTAVADTEKSIVTDMESQGISIKTVPTRKTVYFENIYNENQDHRTQRVLQEADPFDIDHLTDLEANIFHLGPLLTNDIPVEVIKFLSKKGTVSLDVQGYLRIVNNYKVYYTDWREKEEALQYIDVLKANEFEMEALTGTSDVYSGARILADYGVKEVVITLGSLGSILFKDNVFHTIPAYVPLQVTDATGCGDTYMAGYLSQKIQGADLQVAGKFAAAMSTLKIQGSGPFTGTSKEIQDVLENNKTVVYDKLPLS